MPSSMPYDKVRYKMIKDQQKCQDQDPPDGKGLRKAKLIIKGKVSLAPIYCFELKDLYFNKANGRIKAEVHELQTQLGRELDMSEKEDEDLVRKLLLLIKRDENEKIREDLRKNGQIQPGIITCDGHIINGNRRRALLEELYSETHDSKYKYLDVHVLPSNIRKSEVWLIEAGIQLSAPQQLDYSPINHLLKLREGFDSGLDLAEMASRIYGMNEAKLERDLKRLQLIDEYLGDFLGKFGRYHLVNGLAEHFIDLQNILEWLEQPRGRVYRDWTPAPSDMNELKLVAFYYIRGRFPHMRIRDLRKRFCRKSSWEKLEGVIKDIDKGSGKDEPDSDDVKYEPDTDSIDSEFESEGDTVAISGAVVDADNRVEYAWRERNKQVLHAHFEDASEQQKIEEDAARPLELAKRALRNIEAIPISSDQLNDPKLDAILGHIITYVNKLRKNKKKLKRREQNFSRGKSRQSRNK